MKKLFIIMFLLIGTLNAYAYSRLELSEQNKKVDEEIFPIRDENNKLIGILCKVLIPEDYEKDSVVINPDIFGGINEYKNIEENAKIDIILEIKNNSKNNYIYRNNSFYLGTGKVPNAYNYQNTFVKGFDGEEIYDIFSPYRTFNTAIASLFNNKEFNNKDLSDQNLKARLIDNGYNGIEEINRYYLDFYNNKYGLSEESISSFDYKIIREMFTGKVSTYKETNKEIIEFIYNNFFTKTITFNLDKDLEEESIGNYIKNNLGNTFFNDRFGLLEDNGLIRMDMLLQVREEFYLDAYNYYNYSGDFYFVLDKKKD